jgi:Putative zinc-finger
LTLSIWEQFERIKMMDSIHYSEVDLSRYLDGEVSRSERESIASHLTECDSCRHSLAELSLGRVALHALSSPSVPSRIWTNVEAVIARTSVPQQKTRHRYVAIAASILVFAVATSLTVQQFSRTYSDTTTTVPRLAGAAPFDWGLLLSDLDHPDDNPRLERRYAVQDASLESALGVYNSETNSPLVRLDARYEFMSARTLQSGTSRAALFEFSGPDGLVHILVQPSDDPVAFSGYQVENAVVGKQLCLSVYCKRFRAVSFVKGNMTYTVVAPRTSPVHDEVVSLISG